MKVLSLFDGMACGMLAFQKAGIKVKNYDAYEIDKYAIKTATHNFPNIKEHGDVFKADFTQYKGVDFVIGGSPCTYWSIAQKNNRETEASGMGWELFSQYVRAVKEAEPKYFIYENNKSISNTIRESITKAFGLNPICLNSSLVSAQNRQRLYWVGQRNADGSYSQINIKQPKDIGILLEDIIENGIPINTTENGKARTVRATCYKDGIRNLVGNNIDRKTCVAVRINGDEVKDGDSIYYVKNEQITIKGKQYHIKLEDGYYIIRKLTVTECKRLQTIPEWYEFPVSNAQAYKMLGNGWTVDVIAHILSFIK